MAIPLKAKGALTIRLDPDVFAVFPDSRAVNDALREIIRFRKRIGQIIESAAKRKQKRGAP